MVDLLRGLAIAGGGVVFAMALSEALLYYRRKRDPRDPWYGVKRLDYMLCVRVGIALLSLFVIGAVLSKLGDPKLTWRAPSALVCEGFLIFGMWGILRDDETIQDTGASYRVDQTKRQRRRRRRTDVTN